VLIILSDVPAATKDTTGTRTWELPIVVLIALADDVKLGILPNSHNRVLFEGKDTLCQAIEYSFRVGDILVMHPLLVHYGSAYTAKEKSLRAHCYFDNLELERQPEADGRKTYLYTANFQPIVKAAKGVKVGQKKNNRSYHSRKHENT
jgi:hypothetical protein